MDSVYITIGCVQDWRTSYLHGSLGNTFSAAVNIYSNGGWGGGGSGL